MEASKLNTLVQQPNTVDETDVYELETLLREYPYFQAAHLLLATATQNSEQIKTAAAYTAYRSVLKKVINKEFDADVNLPTLDNLYFESQEFNAIEQLNEESDSEVETDNSFQSSGEYPETNFDIPFDASTNEEVTEEPEPLEAPSQHIDFTSEFQNTELESPNEESEQKESEPYEYVKFDEPNYDYPSDSDSSEDELELYTTNNDEVTPQMSSSYDELMASLEALRQTRDTNARIEEEQREEEERLKSAGEVATFAETNEYNSENEEERQTEEEDDFFNTPEPNIFALDDSPTYQESLEDETEGSEPITDKNQVTQEQTFAIDQFLEEYEAKNQKENKPKKESSSTNPFALDALINNIEEKPKKAKSQKTPHKAVNQSDLIDSFIKNNPQINISKEQIHEKQPTNQTDLAKQSVQQNSLAVSENLAQILIKQGKFQKAIEIYSALILKYPDKSAYFAAQIENLKNK